jgi:hypothetical protein
MPRAYWQPTAAVLAIGLEAPEVKGLLVPRVAGTRQLGCLSECGPVRRVVVPDLALIVIG